jgi:hypothetical protein
MAEHNWQRQGINLIARSHVGVTHAYRDHANQHLPITWGTELRLLYSERSARLADHSRFNGNALHAHADSPDTVD